MEWFIVGKLADRRVCASTKPSRVFLANRKVNDWRLKKSTLWFV
jgi:hypothetical protein